MITFSHMLWNRATLWCSACVMAVLLVLQVVHAPPAHADSLQGKGGISMATIRNGYGVIYTSPSCLWVIDDRTEMLFVYYIENVADPRLQLRYSESLPRLFRQARGG
jgi:hypothetical protein